MVQPLLDEIFYRKDARLLHLLPLALLLVFFVKGLFYFAYSLISVSEYKREQNG